MYILGKCREFYKFLDFFQGVSGTYAFENFGNVLGEYLYFIVIISKILHEMWKIFGEIKEKFEKISRIV